MAEVGTKFDNDKPRMDLINPHWELDVARGLTYGAKLHGDHNWMHVHYSRYIAAVKRHINAIQRGEWVDQDSGVPHAALIGCDSMFLHFLIGEFEAHELQRLADRNAEGNSESRTAPGQSVPSDHEDASGLRGMVR